MPKYPTLFLPLILRDIQDIVLWSEEQFGIEAAQRYRDLIRQAIQDLEADPQRPGAKARSDLSKNVYVYHLRFSRDRVPGAIVRVPRHFVLYRFAGRAVEFQRLLHDSRDLAQHVPTEDETRQ